MRKRNCYGSLLVETPTALWILFVLLTIPMIDLASVMIRYTFMVAASRDAAHFAGRAKSFMSDLTVDDPSAMNLANTAARSTAGSFSEISVSSVTTRLLITNLATRVVTRRTTPLTSPADTTANLYEFEVSVAGQINPLVPFMAGPLARIPGLSAPVPVTVTSRSFVENSQGLMQ